MKIYLSYGAGVISEALRLWLIENNYDFEAVWVDHGCDWPETREFAYSIPNLTILKPDVDGYNNLYDYCFDKNIVPSFRFRWCTDKLRINPVAKTLSKIQGENHTLLLGVRIDESDERARTIGRHRIDNGFRLNQSGHSSTEILAPILNYDTEDVWEAILDLPLPKLVMPAL